MATFTLTTNVDTFIGTAGNDTFNATLANFGVDDFLFGGGGSDTLVVGGTLVGPLVLEDQLESIEIVTLIGTAAIGVDASGVLSALLLNGNSAANQLTGTALADVLNGVGGNDTLVGGSGNDSLSGAVGNDSLQGGAGGDTLNGGAGIDALSGGDGDDLVLIAAAAESGLGEVIQGGAGSDTLRFTAGSGTLVLGAGVSELELVQIATAAGVATGTGTVGVNAASAAGALRIEGNNGVNSITGTALDDALVGNGGNDVLTGGAGNDTLIGGAGNDNLAGGDGNDIVASGALAEFGLDTVNGGAGTDTLRFTSTVAGQNLVLVGARVSGLERVEVADAAGDANGTTSLNVDASALTAGLFISGNRGTNTIIATVGADILMGNGGDDVLLGLSGADLLSGEAGADILSGGAGNDILTGGTGADTLRGGMGNDRFELGAGDYVAGEVVDGGSGTADAIAFTGAGQSLDLTSTPAAALRGIEIVDLSGTGNNRLTISASNVIAMNAAGVLRVDGNSGDFAAATALWVQGADTVIGANTYAQYTLDGATLQVDTDVTFGSATTLRLGDLNGADGFQISAEATDDEAGRSVSSAGDVNGDGFADLLVGAVAYGAGNTGAAYVVFGKSGGFSDINLAALGTDGFQITGGASNDYAGGSVSFAGDVNGDGFADFLVGAERYGAGNTGAAYVVFGKGGGFTDINLAALGTGGFRITGEANSDYAGIPVSSAGDVNGDGFADLLVGARRYGLSNNGAAYVVFGKSAGFTDIDLGALGTGGFQITGGVNNDFAGASVSSAGDVNGDGFADLLVGAYGYGPSYNGAAYVVFGKSGGFTDIDLAALGADGFRIAGAANYDNAGRSVSSAGDVNGDGLADILVGAYGYGASNNGAAWVVFGKSGGFTDVNLAALGANGFRIAGGANNDYAGRSVSSAGDVNGDGFADILVGAYGYGASNNGAAYVIFGKSGGFTDIDLAALGADGFQITGEANDDLAGRSVSSAGDVNGDGFADILVGAERYGAGTTGAAYVVLGRDFRGEVDFSGTDGNDALTGAAGDEILIGGLGNDTLDGGAGADVVKGGAGDDVLTYDGFDFQVDGGSGSDTLLLEGVGLALDLSAASEKRISGIEVIDLGSGDHFLLLDAAGLVALTESFHVLRVDGNAGDFVSAGTGWLYTGNIAFGGQAYAQYTQGAAVLQVDTDVSRAIGFDINLSSLSGANGFRITGETNNDYAGEVSSAGDVNGDGFADLFIGAEYGANGAAYVVFGKSGGFTDVNLANVANGTNGFQITGEADGDGVGGSVSSAGDVNGDGFADLLIGAPVYGASFTGAAYVVFGKSGGFTDVNLANVTNGANGFQITGEADGDLAGISVSSAGDVNGDGFGDLLIGAHRYGALENGAAYVLFGKKDGFIDINLSTLSSSDGFQITGETNYDVAGGSVSSAGDVNGDGFVDLIIGASRYGASDTGAAYVLFGKNGGFTNIDLATLAAADGFQITGEANGGYAGTSVSSAGDVNGDGFDDLVIGAPFYGASFTGAAYVLFGKSDGFSDINLASVTNGSNGFQITGEGGSDLAGGSVSSAGDVNGDGFADLIIGATRYGASDTGAAYVVFGKSGGFTDINLGTLSSAEGFQIIGEANDDFTGVSVSSTGDVNGDGFDDLVVGSRFHGASDNGAAYVVFGRDYRGDVDFAGTASDDTLLGTADDNILIGGLGGDTLDGGGGADVLKGGASDDMLMYDAADFRVDGGSGEDTLVFTGAGTFAFNGRHTGIEVVDISGAGNNTLLLQTRDVLDLSDSTHTLRVDGNAGDRVVSTGQGWLLGAQQTIEGVLYQAYIDGAAMLLVDTAVTQVIS